MDDQKKLLRIPNLSELVAEDLKLREAEKASKKRASRRKSNQLRKKIKNTSNNQQDVGSAASPGVPPSASQEQHSIKKTKTNNRGGTGGATSSSSLVGISFDSQQQRTDALLTVLGSIEKGRESNERRLKEYIQSNQAGYTELLRSNKGNENAKQSNEAAYKELLRVNKDAYDRSNEKDDVFVQMTQSLLKDIQAAPVASRTSDAKETEETRKDEEIATKETLKVEAKRKDKDDDEEKNVAAASTKKPAVASTTNKDEPPKAAARKSSTPSAKKVATTTTTMRTRNNPPAAATAAKKTRANNAFKKTLADKEKEGANPAPPAKTTGKTTK